MRVTLPCVIQRLRRASSISGPHAGTNLLCAVQVLANLYNKLVGGINAVAAVGQLLPKRSKRIQWQKPDDFFHAVIEHLSKLITIGGQAEADIVLYSFLYCCHWPLCLIGVKHTVGAGQARRLAPDLHPVYDPD